MPEIREYASRADIQGPVEQRRATAEDFGGGNGLAQVGQAIREVGNAVQRRQEQDEVTRLNEEFTTAETEYSLELKAREQAGDLDAAKFLEKMNQGIDKIGESVETNAGRRFYSQQRAGMNKHFTQNAIVTQSSQAAHKTAKSYLESINKKSATLMNDPSGYEFALEQNSSYLQEMVATGQLPFDAADKLDMESKRELTKSAIRGWIELNPEQTQKEINEGKWDKYLDGDLKKQMEGEADTAIRGRKADEAYQRAEAARVKKERQEQAEDHIVKQMIDGKLTSKEIRNSDLDAPTKRLYFKMMEAEAEKPLKTDNRTYLNLYRRIHLPDTDPDKITDARALDTYLVQGKLNYEALGQLRNEISGTNTPEGKRLSEYKNRLEAHAKATLVKGGILPDPNGEENLSAFLFAAEKQAKAKKKEGLTDDDLYNPSSPHYLGNLIQNFQKTMQQLSDERKTQTDILLGKKEKFKDLPKMNPGESLDDYDKRTGGK